MLNTVKEITYERISMKNLKMVLKLNRCLRKGKCAVESRCASASPSLNIKAEFLQSFLGHHELKISVGT